VFNVKYDMPNFMRNWSRRYQWFFAILLFVLAIVALVSVSEPVQPYIFLAGMLVALILGASSTWLMHVIQVTRQRENIAHAGLVETSTTVSVEGARREGETLPGSYEYCSGNIQSLPDNGLAVCIGGKRYSMGPNGLFFSAKILDGDLVEAVCRHNPFSPTIPLLLAVHVKRTGAVYGVGANVYSTIAIGGACGLFISHTPHEINFAEWIMAAFILFDFVYILLVHQARRILVRCIKSFES